MGLLDGLVSHWLLNEAAGNDRRDSMPEGNHASEVGGSVIQGSPLFTGSINSAEFTRAPPYLQVASPTGLNLGAGSFTICGWGNIDSPLNVDMGFVNKFRPSDDQRQFTLFYFNTAANYRFGVSSDGTDDFSIDDTLVPVGTVFVCAWYDGDLNTINIQTNNGTVVTAAGPTSVFSGAAPLDIGRLDLGIDRVFDGEIDEVSFYNRVLTPEERSERYNDGTGLPFSEFTSDPTFGAMTERAGYVERSGNLALSLPVAAGETIFDGALVAIEVATGRVINWSDTTGQADFFLGLARVTHRTGVNAIAGEAVTGDTAGSRKVDVFASGIALVGISVTGVAGGANVGDLVYATDENTFTLTATPGGNPVGFVSGFISTGVANVELFKTDIYRAHRAI